MYATRDDQRVTRVLIEKTVRFDVQPVPAGIRVRVPYSLRDSNNCSRIGRKLDVFTIDIRFSHGFVIRWAAVNQRISEADEEDVLGLDGAEINRPAERNRDPRPNIEAVKLIEEANLHYF